MEKCELLSPGLPDEELVGGAAYQSVEMWDLLEGWSVAYQSDGPADVLRSLEHQLEREKPPTNKQPSVFCQLLSGRWPTTPWITCKFIGGTCFHAMKFLKLASSMESGVWIGLQNDANA